MTDSLDVHIERLLDATPEQAFAAWVDPVARRGWYAPEEHGWHVEAETDLRVGGVWRAAFGKTADETYAEHGVFSEVDPPNRLAYSCVFTFPNGDNFTTQVTVSFTAQGDKTLMVLDDCGFPDPKTRDDHANGWPAFLDQFDRHLATL